MRKDIEMPKVTDVAIAIVQEKNEDAQWVWMSYIINLKPQDITGVLIASKGYGQKDGEPIKTSILRHFFEKIDAESFQKIELITEDLLSINNEFWLSFYLGSTIYDKKYIFLSEAIQKTNLTSIPLMNKPGILII